MAAAYQLTEADPEGEKYDITVYQQGWRIGGKGASGRNAEIAERIEEHGLHVWSGFYENSFQVMHSAGLRHSARQASGRGLCGWIRSRPPDFDFVTADMAQQSSEGREVPIHESQNPDFTPYRPFFCKTCFASRSRFCLPGACCCGTIGT